MGSASEVISMAMLKQALNATDHHVLCRPARVVEHREVLPVSIEMETKWVLTQMNVLQCFPQFI